MSTLAATGPAGELIVDDRHCSACGYNLRGLFTGAPCPECGQAITLSRRLNNVTPLWEMPTWYRWSLLGGVHLLEIGALLAIAAPFALGDRAIAMALAGGAAGAWLAGVGVFLMPRPIAVRSGKAEWVRLRWAVGLTQAGPLGGLVLVGVGANIGSEPVRLLGLLGILVGAVGLVPFTVYLSLFAEWAGSKPLTDRLRSTGWMLGACAVFIALGAIADAMGTIGPLFGFSVFGTVAKVLWLVSVGYLIYLVFNLDISMRWARRNGVAAHARDVRRAERASEEAQRLVQRAQEVYVPPPPPGAQRSLLAELEEPGASPAGRGPEQGGVGGPGTPQPSPSHWHGPGMEPPDDVEPYALEE